MHIHPCSAVNSAQKQQLKSQPTELLQHLLEELLARAGGTSSDEEVAALLHDVMLGGGGHHAAASLGSHRASGVLQGGNQVGSVRNPSLG